MNRCTAFYYMAKFNLGSWVVALFIGGLAYAVVAQEEGWKTDTVPDNLVAHLLFSGPPLFIAALCFISPILLNPFVLGWPFFCRPRQKVDKSDNNVAEPPKSSSQLAAPQKQGGKVLGLGDFMDASQQIDNEIGRIQNKPDLELGTVRDLFSADGSGYGLSPAIVSRQSSAASSANHPGIQRMPDAYRTSSRSSQPEPLLTQSSKKHETKRSSKFDI